MIKTILLIVAAMVMSVFAVTALILLVAAVAFDIATKYME